VVARLERVRGEIRAGGRPKAKEGLELRAGEALETTGPESSTALRFADGTLLQLDGDTRLGRVADTESGKVVDLLQGAVAAEVVKQPAGRALVLTTPHAEARVLGTRLRLAVEPDGTRLEVREGRVRFTRTRDGSTAEVGAGAFATTSAPRVAARVFREAAFQDGAAPIRSYAGTRDTYLSETHPGNVYGDSATVQVDGDNPGGSGKDLNLLLRWDLSAMPRSAKVLSAVVTLRESHPARRPFPAYPLLRAWTEEAATWLRASEPGLWQSPGAAGAGDRGAVPLGVLAPREEGVYELRLNAEGLAVVQGWIEAPERNHGLILPGGDGSDGLQVPSREHPDPARRPKLTLTYLPR
jgi:hypothetical protein